MIRHHARATAAILGLSAVILGGCSVSVVSQETFAECQEFGSLSLDENILSVKADSPDDIAELSACLAENTKAPDGAFNVLSEPVNAEKLAGDGLFIDVNTWTVTDGQPAEGFDINIG